MERRILRIVTVLVIVVPLIILWWSLALGAIALFLGAFVAAQTSRQLRALSCVEGNDLRQQRENQSALVFVSLLAPDGAPLDPDAAQARLEAARLKAGPRAEVVGVYRDVEPMALPPAVSARSPQRRWGVVGGLAVVAVLGWGVSMQGWRPAWMGLTPVPPPSAGWVTIRMPLPPPPATALISTG